MTFYQLVVDKMEKTAKVSVRRHLKTVGHYGAAAGVGAATLHALQALLRKKKGHEKKAEDTISVDVPLFIRLLEWAHEDAKTDMQLHKATKNLIGLGARGPLTMEHYDKAVSGPDMPPLVKKAEDKKKKKKKSLAGTIAKGALLGGAAGAAIRGGGEALGAPFSHKTLRMRGVDPKMARKLTALRIGHSAAAGVPLGVGIMLLKHFAKKEDQ